MGIIIIMAPEKIPAEPRPAMARPTIKTGELGAAPQMALPASKMTTDVRKTLSSPNQYNANTYPQYHVQDIPFHIVVLVEAAKDKLTGCRGEHICRAIPTDITQTMEFVGDCRNSRGENGSIQSYQEHCQEVCQQSQPEPQTLGLVEVVRAWTTRPGWTRWTARWTARTGRHHGTGLRSRTQRWLTSWKPSTVPLKLFFDIHI